ncbi:hypothetical protein BDK62_12277 [Halomonas alkaliantarctica]|nr:hypothetical protein BDK62_12277 [Halomonas alkaliantarctica]
MPSKPLPVPSGLLNSVDMQVQEIMYGHRLTQEQEPYMILLEVLHVCNAQPLGSVKPSEDNHEAFKYTLPRRRKLRFLLFADRQLEQVVNDQDIADSEKWSVWKKRVNHQFQGNTTAHDEFAYLDEAFDSDINALLQAVRLLRAQEVDVMHNRRWTSRFLSVTGPETLCPDMREFVNQAWSMDRRFFGRGGELVYLMLNRSSRVEELKEQIASNFLDEKSPMNQVAMRLTDDNEDGSSGTEIGYLPYRHHEAYDRIADDWCNLLDLHLPDGHLFEPLFRITGLNLVTYLAQQTANILGSNKPEPIVADLTDGSDKQFREICKMHLNRHRLAANRAVKTFITDIANQDEEWQAAVTQGDGGAAKDVLRRLFAYKHRDMQIRPPLQQLNTLIEQATSRDKNNLHKYLLPLTKGIGLATSRQRIGSWFGLDDGLLFALVMANVTHTVELRDFVAQLYERYGIVIGPEEARQAFTRLPVGVQSFETNLAALEQRMTRLALTQRLSDDCAFVTNPYRGDV